MNFSIKVRKTMDNIAKIVGENLRVARKAKGLTQQELAKELEPLKAEIKGIQRELGKLMANNEVKNIKKEGKD